MQVCFGLYRVALSLSVVGVCSVNVVDQTTWCWLTWAAGEGSSCTADVDDFVGVVHVAHLWSQYAACSGRSHMQQLQQTTVFNAAAHSLLALVLHHAAAAAAAAMLHVACRNTVFNAAAQSGLYYLPRLAAAGYGSFRIELVDESPEMVGQLLEGYR
jgi:hypothetical protein